MGTTYDVIVRICGFEYQRDAEICMRTIADLFGRRVYSQLEPQREDEDEL